MSHFARYIHHFIYSFAWIQDLLSFVVLCFFPWYTDPTHRPAEDLNPSLWLLQKAVDLMSQVPKLCNDMMNLGRLQGYEVRTLPVHSSAPSTCYHYHRLWKVTATHKMNFVTNPMCLQGKLTCQGKLLQQETFFVTEQDAGVLSRSKERRVFLFEQIVIFSELLRKGSSTPGYQFKKSIKVHRG